MGAFSEAFPRQDRVRRRREFKAAYSDGMRVSGRYLVLFAVNNGSARSRLGITATRRLGKATVRNRLKRLVRETYRRRSVPAAVLDEGRDVIVNVRESAAAAESREVRSELLALLSRMEGRSR